MHVIDTQKVFTLIVTVVEVSCFISEDKERALAFKLDDFAPAS